MKTSSQRPLTAAVALAGVSVFALMSLGPPDSEAAPGPEVSHFSTAGRHGDTTVLVSGRLVRPSGRRTALGDFPVALTVSPNGRTAVVSNSGQGEGAPEQSDESLQVVDVASGKVIQTVRDHEADKPVFYESGLVWSSDGSHLYATGGGNDQVYDYRVQQQRLTLAHRWRSSTKAGAPVVPGSQNGGVPGSAPLVGDVAGYSRGLALLPDGSAVVVTNEQGSSVAALSTNDGHVLWETTIAGPGQPAGGYPEAVVVSLDGSTAYVAAQGLNAVASFDTATGVLRGLTPVGDHPVALTLGQAGTRLYVANANDDSVSVLDTTSSSPEQIRMLSTHLVDGEANGSTPDGLAFDDRTGSLYVALAGDNAVAVFRGNRLHRVGSIATGSYPTALQTLVDGRLLVVSAKGLGGAPITNHNQYIVNKRRGLLTTVRYAAGGRLATMTRQTRNSLLYPSKANALRPAGSPIPATAHAGRSPIKHVFLIVRENRTFDQVFGDLKRPDANVRPAYTEFGRRNGAGQTVTPNIHRLATRFALSQNFYSDGEASIQGHHWTAEGVSTDYTEKSYLHYYSNRNHAYDPTAPIGYPRCGSIFDQLARQGRTFRNFGELVGLATAQTPTQQVAPGSSCGTPGYMGDAGSAANFEENLGANLSLTSVADTVKEQDIEAKLAPLVAADQVPQFTYAVLGNDHTDGTAPGKKTPEAHVATNDYAVGKLVDYLSHTPQWKSTAVFVVEDDSQDGLDHVDGHRNIMLAASPWVKPGALSSLHISQASVLHTIELILGIKPLSSYTQLAPVPYEMFTSTPHLAPYASVRPTYPMDQQNPSVQSGTAASVPIDLRIVDVAGPVLEAQIWEATHPGIPMPAQLLAELSDRGGITAQALRAWAAGRPCACEPLQPGLTVAPGEGD